jgi:hypothetical protein
MTALETAQALGLTGTDAEIVAVLRTLSRDNIPAASVRTWLRQDRDPVLLAYDGSAWYGTLEDMLKANQLPAEMVAGLRELKALMLEGGVLRTTQPGPAGRVYRIVAGIAQIIGGDPLETIGSFFRLDGGQPFKDLTVEAFAAQKADAARLAEAEQWLASVFNEIINPAASDPARTLSSVKAAVALAAVTP